MRENRDLGGEEIVVKTHATKQRGVFLSLAARENVYKSSRKSSLSRGICLCARKKSGNQIIINEKHIVWKEKKKKKTKQSSKKTTYIWDMKK